MVGFLEEVEVQGFIEGWGVAPSTGEGMLGWVVQVMFLSGCSDYPCEGPLKSEVKITLH